MGRTCSTGEMKNSCNVRSKTDGEERTWESYTQREVQSTLDVTPPSLIVTRNSLLQSTVAPRTPGLPIGGGGLPDYLEIQTTWGGESPWYVLQ